MTGLTSAGGSGSGVGTGGVPMGLKATPPGELPTATVATTVLPAVSMTDTESEPRLV